MPFFPLPFPAGVHPESVTVRRRTAAGVSTSPTSYQQQVYQHPGARWEIDVKLQPMPRDAAAEFTQFFFDLQGRVGTFLFDLGPHVAGLAPAPGVVRFRLSDPDPGWTERFAAEFDFSFSAVEDIT